MFGPSRHRQLIGMTLYLLASLALIVVALLPLSPGRIGWPGPDLLTLVTFAWVLRRPEQVPVLVIAVVMLAAPALAKTVVATQFATAAAAAEIGSAMRHPPRKDDLVGLQSGHAR